MRIKIKLLSLLLGCSITALSGGRYEVNLAQAARGYKSDRYPFDLDSTEPFTKLSFRSLLLSAQQLGVDLEVTRLVTSEHGFPVVRHFLHDRVMPLVKDRFVDPVSGQEIVEVRKCVVKVNECGDACIKCSSRLGPYGPEGWHDGMQAAAEKRTSLLAELADHD